MADLHCCTQLPIIKKENYEVCCDRQTHTHVPRPAIKIKKRKTKALNWSKWCANAHRWLCIYRGDTVLHLSKSKLCQDKMMSV